ncbi:MAG TPA: ABC transporter permease [bacterium]|nr:ABC transporter permease [bacterium]
MGSLRRVRAVMHKELAVLLRDRFYLLMAIGFPLVTMLLMGYGMNYDVRNVPLGIADLDGTADSRALTAAFTASGYFRLVTVTRRPRTLDDEMAAGRIRAAIEIPSGMARALAAGRVAAVLVAVDGSFPLRADIARGYAEAIVARFNQDRLATAVLRVPTEAAVPSLTVESRIWFNPTLDSNNFIVPGLLVINLLMWPPVLTSLTVTREKESGAILNVQTAPIAGWEYMLGKLIPYAGISFLSYWLLLACAVGLFHVRMLGSLVALSLGALLFVTATGAIGLVISVLVRTQVAALLATVVVVMVPGMEYSGFAEPISTLDASGRLMSHFFPAADFMFLARGVFLKGFGLAASADSLMRLAAYAAAAVLAATLAFRKRRKR